MGSGRDVLWPSLPEGVEPQEEETALARGAKEHHPFHSGLGVSGTGSIAPVLVEFSLLVVLVQRFEERDQRCDVAGCKCDPLKLHGTIA